MVVVKNIKTVADKVSKMANVEEIRQKVKELKGILIETGHSL